VRCAAERFTAPLGGADMMITSTVPIGAGLSSSAALEVAVGFAYLSLNDIEIDRLELAFAGQQAEHKFVGTRSGIMDQFAAAFGRMDNAMLLDCRSLDIDYIPIANDETEIVVIDTKVKHNLASSEYNTRRAECEKGVELLSEHLTGITSLRDVTMETLEQYGDTLPDQILRRCRHVVTENERTVTAAELFRQGEFFRAGGLMFDSHRSLRIDYEVSCAELDYLVEVARWVDGVYGARMTGGGFGGCTVNLVNSKRVEEFGAVSTERYRERFGIEPDVYIFQPADGASEITASGSARSPIDASGSSM
jgi:galactokinase